MENQTGWWKPGIPTDNRINAKSVGTIARRRGMKIGQFIRFAIEQAASDDLTSEENYTSEYPPTDTIAVRECAS